MEILKKINKELVENYSLIIDIRRDLHMNPELSFKEERTPLKIVEYLQSWGVHVETNVGGNGVVGTIYGNKEGPTIALRADFDALPIQDQKNVIYKSTIPNVMHACGHDAHTAALLGVTKVLAHNRNIIKGAIKIIFQFAEEVADGGAKPMIAAGCLKDVDAIYGAHVWTPLKVGEVSVIDGHAMASFDGFELEILGSGGHGAAPHTTIDPIVAGSRLIINLQEIISRRIDPLEKAVITVGVFNSGNFSSTIPEKAYLAATIRSYSNEVRSTLEHEIRRTIHHSLSTSGASYKLNYKHGYPSLYNHKENVETVKEAINLFKEDIFYTKIPSLMQAEDFAYYLQEKPGAFFFVGAGSSDNDAYNYPHHHEKFDIDEKAMLNIGKVFLGIVYLSCIQ